MTATSCDIWLVTDNKNRDAVALSAIHNDIKAKEGRPVDLVGAMTGCAPGDLLSKSPGASAGGYVLRPFCTAIQPASNPNSMNPIAHIHPCQRKGKFGSIKTG